MDCLEQIHKNCDDREGAEAFLRQMKEFCEDVYIRDEELTTAKADALEEYIKSALTYKVAEVNFGFCCKLSFRRKGMKSATSSLKIVKAIVIGICLVNVGVSAVTSYFDHKQYVDFTANTALKTIQDEEFRIVYPTQILQMVSGLVNIYIVMVLHYFHQKQVSKDDPFDNSILIVYMIFFVTVQRVIFSVFLYHLYSDKSIVLNGVRVVPNP